MTLTWFLLTSIISAAAFLIGRFFRNSKKGNGVGLEKTIPNQETGEQELKDKAKEMESFLYMVSHALKTPLVSMHGILSVIQDEHGRQLNEEGRFHISRLIANIQRMKEMITALLELSEIGKMEKLPREIDVNRSINEAMEDLEKEIAEKGAMLTIQQEMGTANYNPSLMRQVFSNLIENSIKYNRVGHSPKIEIKREKAGKENLFLVKDNGVGIESKYHKIIFVPFQRFHTSENIPGTGVGLAIVKKIVEFHGGKIWVESRRGKGSVFYFTVP